MYVNNVIKGKLLQLETLQQQAMHNTKNQFSGSPDLDKALENAIIDALDAHNKMSSQALNSKAILQGLKEILLGPGQLYELLRGEQVGDPTQPNS